MTIIGKWKNKERKGEKEKESKRGEERKEMKRRRGREMQLLKFASNAVNRMLLPENAPVRAKRRRPMRGEQGKEEVMAGMRVYRETTCCGAVGGGGVH